MNTDSIKSNIFKQKRLLQLFWATELSLILVLINQLSIESWITSLGVLFVFILLFSVYFLTKKGRTELAGNVLLLILSCMILLFMWMFEGVKDEVLLIFPAILIFSLHTGSQKFPLILCVVISVNVLTIGYLNDIGFITNQVSKSSLTSAVLVVIILWGIAYNVWLFSSDMKEINKALLINKNSLELRVNERTIELQQSIAHLENTQTQLVEAEKMASLGRLVAGISHEINTPLGIAITASSYLETVTQNFDDLFQRNHVSRKNMSTFISDNRQSTALILSNLQRAVKLVQSFKEVAVDQTSNKKREFNLKKYLEEILTSLQPKLKHTNINVQLNCADNILIYSAPGALAQIITNLFINALIHGFNKQDEGKISIFVQQKENNIHLDFIDNGRGISSKNLEHIFEPFFTTTRGKGGSGLGLNIVYNLIHQSLHGSISCSSKLGSETKFQLVFPSNIKE